MASLNMDVQVRYVAWRFAIGTAVMRVPWLPIRVWAWAFNFAVRGATLGGEPLVFWVDVTRKPHV